MDLYLETKKKNEIMEQLLRCHRFVITEYVEYFQCNIVYVIYSKEIDPFRRNSCSCRQKLIGQIPQ